MKQLFGHVVSLSLLQLLQYFIPVLLLPYVVRALGPESFGRVNVAQSLVWYVVLLVNYGFEVTATRGVALRLQQPDALKQYFADVFGTKFILLAASAVLYSLLILGIPSLWENRLLYAIFFLLPIGYVLMPNWYFLGIQRYQQIVWIYVVTRLLSLLAIIWVVKTPDHDLWYAVLFCGGQAIAGMLGLALAVYHHGAVVRPPAVKRAMVLLSQGFPVFIGLLVTGVMTATYVFVIGQVATAEETGYFAAIMRLMLAIMGILFVPLSQIVLPRVTKQFALGYATGIFAFQASLLLVVGIGLLVGLGLMLVGHWLVLLFLGEQYAAATKLLYWLAFVPMINGCVNVMGTQGMLNVGLDKTYMRINMAVMVIGTLLLIPLCQAAGAIGAAICWLLVELIHVLLLAAYLFRKEASIFRFQHPLRYLKGGSMGL